MKRLLASIAFALAAAAGQASQDNWLYWSVADAATSDGAVEFAYAVLCDSEDWTRTYAVGETDASKVRANADASSTPAVASDIGGTSGTASAEPSSFVVLLYDAENEVVAVSKTVSRETLAKHVYVDMRTAGEGSPYVFSSFAKRICVKPGEPLGPYTTAEEATNAMAKAVLAPRDDVAEKLGAGSPALGAYCNMFGFAVTGGGEAWFVEAGLYPQAWSNVMESAQAATRQIPLADIAVLPLNTPTNVTARGCGVPGFYYSFYSGGAVTNLRAVAVEKGLNVLCGTDKDVKFEGVVKPSDAAGFFSIGVKETPGVQPSDRAVPAGAPIITPAFEEE